MSLTLYRRHLNNQMRAAQWVNISEGEFAKFHMTREQAQNIQATFDGKLVFPGDPDYDQDRKLSNPAFQKYPVLIAYCVSESDVRTILHLCQGKLREKLNPHLTLPLVVRSGGHSTAGYSAIDGGVILDTSQLDSVFVDPQHRRLHAGPGAEFKILWDALDRYGFAVTAGVCPDVRVGGYMQGGGYGWNARMFGMNCDNVMEVEVMLADGSVVLANETTNCDLYYAVCGGTGNNFGVLLHVTYQVYPLKYIHGFSIVWDVSTDEGAANGAVALDLLQRQICYCG
jgi:FAD/FMN-containing dehydrogenase